MGLGFKRVIPYGEGYALQHDVFVLADGVTVQDGRQDGYMKYARGECIPIDEARVLGLLEPKGRKESTVAEPPKNRRAKPVETRD